MRPWMILSALALGGCADCTELRAQMDAVTEQTQSCASDADCVKVDGPSGTIAQCGAPLNQKSAGMFASLYQSFQAGRCSDEVVHCPSPWGPPVCVAGICARPTSSSARGRR